MKTWQNKVIEVNTPYSDYADTIRLETNAEEDTIKISWSRGGECFDLPLPHLDEILAAIRQLRDFSELSAEPLVK